MTQKQIDDIDNALLIGMDVSDAYVYAGLTPAVIASLAEDEEWQAHIARRRKQHEFSLLSKLDKVQDKQVHMGRESAITWALEHMYPRYANKAQDTAKIVSITFGEKDPADEDTVEINTGTDAEASNSADEDTVEINTGDVTVTSNENPSSTASE